MKRVFLSSGVRGLKEFRDAAANAIEKLDGYHCIRMENFSAGDYPPIDECLAQLQECDIFVGILGHCYGSFPPGCPNSYSELEFEEACRLNMPRLMFLATESMPVPADVIENDDKRKRQTAFRNRVRDE